MPGARTQDDRAARFRRTRADHRDETAEDYVEAIADIIDAGAADGARVRDLSRLFGVSHVTVTRIVARLSDKGLVQTEPRRPITLTAAGRKMAAESRTRHETVLAFLLAIGVPRKQAEIDAEGLEHHVSDATIKRLRAIASRLSG